MVWSPTLTLTESPLPTVLEMLVDPVTTTLISLMGLPP
jgi:hypothetical protein